MHKEAECDNVEDWRRPVDAEGMPLLTISHDWDSEDSFWAEVISEVLKTSWKFVPLRNIQTIYFSPEDNHGAKFESVAARLLTQEYKGLKRLVLTTT